MMGCTATGRLVQGVGTGSTCQNGLQDSVIYSVAELVRENTNTTAQPWVASREHPAAAVLPPSPLHPAASAAQRHPGAAAAAHPRPVRSSWRWAPRPAARRAAGRRPWGLASVVRPPAGATTASAAGLLRSATRPGGVQDVCKVCYHALAITSTAPDRCTAPLAPAQRAPTHHSPITYLERARLAGRHIRLHRCLCRLLSAAGHDRPHPGVTQVLALHPGDATVTASAAGSRCWAAAAAGSAAAIFAAPQAHAAAVHVVGHPFAAVDAVCAREGQAWQQAGQEAPHWWWWGSHWTML